MTLKNKQKQTNNFPVNKQWIISGVEKQTNSMQVSQHFTYILASSSRL